MLEDSPNRIAYSLEVLDRIRDEAEAAYYRLARGGLETGGVLFGKREGPQVRITAFRPFECEHALGPSFKLSENDLARFAEAVRAVETDPELSGLEAVGWYHSHTRTEVALSPDDLQISNRFFQEPGQIALVVRPHHFAPMKAGFFVREQDGSVRGSASLREFAVLPLLKPETRRPERRNGGGEGRAGQEPAFPAAPPTYMTADTAQTAAPERDLPSRYLPARHTGAGIPPWEPPTTGRHRRDRPWLWVAVAAVLLGAAALGARHWFSDRPRQALLLQLGDLEGQLRIEWDREATPVIVGSDAVIDIEDGTGKSSVVLDAPRLRQGRIIYGRRTGKVDIHMRVSRSGHLLAEEFAQFVGAVPVSAPSPARNSGAVQPGRDDGGLAQQLETVRAELAQQSEEIRRLKGQPAAGIAEPPRNPAPASAPGPAAGRRPDSPAAYEGPTAGRLVWTGQLKRGATVSIYGGRASVGRLTGQLPGVPVRIRVSPAAVWRRRVTVFAGEPGQVGAAEPASPQNGNNRITYQLNRPNAGGIGVINSPGTQNAWRALTLRSEERDISAFVVFWEVVKN